MSAAIAIASRRFASVTIAGDRQPLLVAEDRNFRARCLTSLEQGVLRRDVDLFAVDPLTGNTCAALRRLLKIVSTVDAGLSSFEEMQIEFGRGLVDYGVALGRRWAA